MRFVLIMILAVLSGCATIPQENKCIRLTFDDGPNSLYTEKILDTLKSRNVKATFFVVGRHVLDMPAITKRTAAEGHSIGNHTWSHPHLTDLPLDGVWMQLQATSEVIDATIGRRPTEWRPPYMQTNRSINAIAENLEMRYVDWTVDAGDWDGLTAQAMTTKVLKEVKSNSVIIMHDIHPATAQALPVIIDGIKAKGYCFQ